MVDCDVLAFGGEGNEDQVEVLMGVMDAADAPGMGNRAIIFLLLPLEENEIGLGAIYELTR